MGEIHRIHGERTAFDRALAFRAFGALRGISQHVAFSMALATPLESTSVDLRVEDICERTGWSTGAVHRALRELVALGLVARYMSPGGKVGTVFTWQSSRLRELADSVTGDNVTCGQFARGAALTVGNDADGTIELWRLEWIEAWDARWARDDGGRRVSGVIRPPWPRDAGWQKIIAFGGDLASVGRSVEDVVREACRGLLRAGPQVDPRIVDERHPLPFLYGRDAVARWVARQVDRALPLPRVERERQAINEAPPLRVEVPDFVHQFLRAGGAS